MHFARTILALLIALSVAVLPVAGSGASVAGKPETARTMAMHSHSSDMADPMDCCPSGARAAQPCDHANGRCDMAFCAAPSVTIANPAAFQVAAPIVLGSALPLPNDQIVSVLRGSPPFRPPRV